MQHPTGTCIPDHRDGGLGATEPAVTVSDVMIRYPKLCDPATTVAQARHMLLDDHVHALLIMDGTGVLVAVVERDDLADRPGTESARSCGRLDGRVVGPDADLSAVRRYMTDTGRRRFAVAGDDGVLLGLLCLKRSRRGFCSDEGVAARAAERSASGTSTGTERSAGGTSTGTERSAGGTSTGTERSATGTSTGTGAERSATGTRRR